MTDTLAPINGPAAPTVRDLLRMTGSQILTTYGPQVYDLVGRLQASGAVVWQRTDYDVAVTNAMRREIIAKEGDCRCGKIDCWKRELGM